MRRMLWATFYAFVWIFCACQGEKVYLKHVFQEKWVQFFKNFGACGAKNVLSNKGCLGF